MLFRETAKTTAMKLQLLKSQGSGNDFFLIDIRPFETELTSEMKRDLAIFLCNRDSAFGADGILFVESSVAGDAKMIIYNADGSEAKMCGNGIRIVGRYIAEDTNKPSVGIENVTGEIFQLEAKNDFYEGLVAFELKFPQANFDAKMIPLHADTATVIDAVIPALDPQLRFTGLSLPNPHLVSFVDHMEESQLIAVGTLANTSKAVLPNGTNINFGKVIDTDTIYVATFERGVGITFSCGTGMFATAVSAVKNGLVAADKWVTLLNKGGYTKCFINSDFSGKMIGNASYLYDANIDFDFKNLEIVTHESGKTYTEEIEAYDKLVEEANELSIT